MTQYLVKQRYLDTAPGEILIADLDPAMEQRAVQRGAIEVISRERLTIDPSRARMPRDQRKEQ